MRRRRYRVLGLEGALGGFLGALGVSQEGAATYGGMHFDTVGSKTLSSESKHVKIH